MTREEAKQNLFTHTPKMKGMRSYMFEVAIDEIFDYFENRTCDNCIHCSDIVDNSYRCDLFECYQQKAIKYCGNWEIKNE